MEELSELLDDFDVEFTWINKTTLGLIDPYQSIIKINLYLLIAETLMHEMVHWQIPKLGEAETERVARAKIQRMSVKEIKQMVDYIVAVRRRNGKND